jgi:hypothetical protein
MAVVTSTFWIAGNMIFDTETGATRPVLMLVNKESDATIFYSHDEARNYFSFVSNRAKQIQWTLDGPSIQRPRGWVIRGIQTTKIDEGGFSSLGTTR